MVGLNFEVSGVLGSLGRTNVMPRVRNFVVVDGFSRGVLKDLAKEAFIF